MTAQFSPGNHTQITNRIGAFLLIAVITLASGCATSQQVPFVVHSAPEGGHVLFKIETNQPSNWIYLGTTPLQALHTVEHKAMDSDSRFTLRILHNGYLEQRKEWSGETFEDILDSKSKITWNPRLVPSKSK